MRKDLLTGGVFRSNLFSELLAPNAAAPSLEPGTRVGAWRIERLIGRGGMSEVFLAQREAQDFDQAVAIKLLAVDGEDPEFVRAERRILGKLRHPAIATLIDGGELESGRVWFAMEYVDGEPIDAYAESHALGWMERLGLIERLCEAVGYAHAHLLVHRDIKPSNVLVDANGHPKLIDFGIAIAAQGREVSGRWLTPGYAAPEQLTGGPITTATDIYQLGQLLKCLMTSAGAVRPPHRVARGDLDRIVARATHDAPDRRYPSAAALAADLAALRTHRPLPAHRTGAAQRVRLWALRHAWAAWLAVPMLLAAAGSAFVAFQSSSREAAEKAMALREEQVSSATGSFFVDLLNEPVTAEGEVGGLSLLLDRGQRRLLSRPNPVPEVQAALLQGLAQTNARMERRAMAIELFEEAARVQRRAGLDAPLAHTLAALAGMRGIEGDIAAGERLADEASTLLARDERFGRDRYLALLELSQYYGNTFAFARASAVLDQALAVGERRYGPDSPELYRAQRLRASHLQNQWQVATALPLAAQLAKRCEQLFGADDARCIVDLTHWQRVRALAGETREARAAYGRLWERRDDWEGTHRHYRTHAVQFGLAEVEWIEGNYPAARSAQIASLCELARAQGETGPHWISDRGALALLLLDMGAAREALRVSSEAKGLLAADLGGSLEHSFWAVRQAKIERANGFIDPATEAAAVEAVERMRATYGARSYFAARAEHALALVHASRGRHAEAQGLLEIASRSDGQGLRYFHSQLLAEIDTLRAELGKDDAAAIAYLARARDGLARELGPSHPLTAAATIRLASTTQRARLDVDAVAVASAYRVLSEVQAVDAPDLAEALVVLRAANGQVPTPATAPPDIQAVVPCD